MHDDVYSCQINPDVSILKVNALPSTDIDCIRLGRLIETPSSPYEEGKTLNVSVTEGVPPNKRAIQLQILRPIQPYTLSCVMEVKVLAGFSSTKKQAKHAILKLYDWRYAAQLRQDHKVDPWTPDHEAKYRAFVETGDAAKFISALEDDDDTDDPQLWDTARDETFLYDYCRDLHSCEVEAYSRLQNLQGRNIPQFLADVTFNAFPMQKNAFFQVRGILLELITGYSLADLAKYAHPSSWQRICDEAIHTINLISNHGVLNEDVKTRNVLVRTHDDNNKDSEDCEVVTIDFAQCRFREMNQSEADWRHEKCRQDEEGAIGYVMAHKLNGAVEYTPSYRFQCTCTKCTTI
ncbi:MAG: hypothetical protein L6R35_001257 [Caloplaca aegaea]|nr:MAG: hypothetical protein L6R35_001257 [Caloplaca aegaea]